MKVFLIGIDYGTESARGILLDGDNGEVVAVHRHAYAHGVMDEALPDGTRLPSQWALQDADDYLDAAAEVLSRLGDAARRLGGEVAGIGIDFTASSPLPTRADGVPLSRLHPGQPHAYVKLWKHHAAQVWADRINASGADWLRLYGGQTSCEWVPAKAAEMAHDSPELWAQAERFIEGGDWVVSQLVGSEVRSACQAGYKAHYQPQQGYPADLDRWAPGLLAKLAPPRPVGDAAGLLSEEWLARTGLPGRPAVAVATIDAHAVVPAVGVSGAHVMVCSLGTSACQLLVDEKAYAVPGVGGVVQDGILPGSWGYECGQVGFGDLLAWFARAFPAGESQSASFEHYEAAAERLAPGESGVLALDWWNGCRTPLMDPELSGLFVGMTLKTTPAELYRALLESLCFGTRRIVQTLEEGGLRIDRLVLTSGLAERSPVLCQLLCDVTQKPAVVPAVSEATARGAAMHGAVAAAVVADFAEAVQRYAIADGRRYRPRGAAGGVYEELYAAYVAVADRFAGGSEMGLLRRLREQARSGR